VSSVLATSKATEITELTAVPASRYLVFGSLAISGWVLDLWTKHWVFQWLGMPKRDNQWWLWEGYVGIETALNSGALFGFGTGYGSVFALLSVIAAAGILFWLFRLGAAHDWLLTVALGCVMGGIGGNLYDRLGLWQNPANPGEWRNEVRDWILLRYQGFTWPNFNIADSLLVCGALLLVWHGLFHTEPPAEKSRSTSNSAERRSDRGPVD
jgi:signal peptidase II